MVESAQRMTTLVALHQSGLYDRVASRKPLWVKRIWRVILEFAKLHLKYTKCMRNKIIWFEKGFDWDKLNLKKKKKLNFGQNFKHCSSAG